jgi:predicted permease
MRIVDIARLRLRSLFSRRAVERELEDELRYHLEREAEENPGGALRAAYGLAQRREECRDARGLNLFDNLRRDLAFAARQLRKNPAFTATAIAVLALGMCASLAIFAFVDATLIQPIPYRDPAHLLAVNESNGSFQRANLSYPDFVDWSQRNRVLRSLDVYQQNPFILTAAGGAQPVRGARVSAGFFRTLGVAPALGRDFEAGEDTSGAPRVAILSFAVWQQSYGARRDVLGQTAILDSVPYVIVGVLPRQFHFALADRPDYWTPLQATRPCDVNRQCHSIYGVARLAGGFSRQAALADLQSIAADLEKQYPVSNRARGVVLRPLAEAITGDIHPMLMVLFCGAGLLLLIAAVNVAGLVLLRSQSRRREIALRLALGASAARLASQFATEALSLTAGGAILGLALAAEAIQLLQRLLPENFRLRLPFLDGLSLNSHVLLAAAAIAAFAALLLAVPPCLGIRPSNLRDGLAEASRGSAGTLWRTLGSNLVVVELATAMVLLVGAGLFGKSLYRLMRVDLGIQPDRLVTLDVSVPRKAYSTTSTVMAVTKRIESDIESLPGVKSVGVAVNGVPVTYNGNTTWFHIPGRPWHGEHYDAPERDVSPDYFSTLGARLLQGRYFNQGDVESAHTVAIVNRALMRTYFPDGDVVGKQIIEHNGGLLVSIVGVVDDIREGPLDDPIPPVLYFPFAQRPDTGFTLVVRAAGAEHALLSEMSASIRHIDAGIVTSDGATMLDRIQASQSAYMHRSLVWLVGAFAAVALVLSVIGLYGVVTYSVNQRNREIGIRSALGASRASIYRMILREAGGLIALGAAAGIACSIAAAGFMRSLLFGVRSWDLPTLAAIAALLSAVALMASWIPARRAASVDPVESLRAE